MGHLVNARGFRLGTNKFWNFKSTNIKHYFEQVNVYNFLNYYLESFFSAKRFKSTGFVYSHFILKNLLNRSIVDIYLFGGYIDVLNTLFLKNRRKYLNVLGGKEIYFKKYVRYCQNLIVNIIRKRLLVDLQQLGIFDINFFFYTEKLVSVEIVGKIIALKLEGMYSLNQIVKPIVNVFHKKSKGLVINCSGRFTRKQRAHFVRFKQGAVSLSTITKNIDYFFIPVRLKYGSCGIKIWVTK